MASVERGGAQRSAARVTRDERKSNGFTKTKHQPSWIYKEFTTVAVDVHKNETPMTAAPDTLCATG
jgi:hypothetical protein